MRARLATIALAVAAGIFLLLLAQDVRSWNGVLRDDAVQAEASTAKQPRLAAPTMLPENISSSLLSVGRDRAWLDAIQKFGVAYDRATKADSLGLTTYALLHRGEAAVRKLTRDPDRVRASQAYDLLAVLVLREAYPGGGNPVDASLLQEGLTDLQDALRLDPSNQPAKENLELTLRSLVAAGSVQQQQHRGAGNHVTNKKAGGFGGPPGEGY